MWKDLSMQQRADLMDIYLSHGISSLDEMKNHYDSRNQFADRGNLFSGEDTPTQQMNNGLNLYRNTNKAGDVWYTYQETPDSEEILLTPTNKRFSDDPTNWDYKDASGREYSPRMVNPTSSSTLESSEKMGPLEKYVAELNWRVKNDPASIALQGKYTMPAVAAPLLAPLGEAFAGTTIAGVPATTWANTAMAAGFAGHGLNHTINEGINGLGDAAMTAMELTPLGRLARPVYEGVVQPGMRLFNSPLTGNWTRIGNREYRLSPNSLGANGSPIESRSIVSQITAENAASITPEQWTAAQDAAIARGDMVEARRLSDLHSNIAAEKEGFTAYNTYRSQKPNNKYKWENKSPYDDSRYGIGKSSGYFSIDSEPVARTYKYTDDSPLFNLNIYMKNPYIKDVEGRSWQFVDTRIAPNGAKYGVTTDEIVNKVKPEGVYDGVIFKNIVDVGAFRRNLNGASDVATDYVSFPGRAKLRDAVTYDDNGVRIPLGERHNFNINDIRYGLLPFGIGLTGYGLWQGNK